MIREATLADWPAMWPFMQGIIAAGDTFSWDPDLGEDRARAIWFRWQDQPVGHTVVAVLPDGTILGTAETGPNHGGGASHIAGASFMVDPRHQGHGTGRALGEHVIRQAQIDGYRGMQFNAVVETNAVAVKLWQSLGFQIMTTIPEGFRHPTHGFVGLHIMYQRL